MIYPDIMRLLLAICLVVLLFPAILFVSLIVPPVMLFLEIAGVFDRKVTQC